MGIGLEYNFLFVCLFNLICGDEIWLNLLRMFFFIFLNFMFDV